MVMRHLGLKAGWSTNQGVPTKRFGFVGTDLGYLFEGGKGQWVGSIFGDTFDKAHPKAKFSGNDGWRSPVILRTSNRDFTSRGVVWDNAVGGARAKQVWDYRRIGENASPAANTFDASTIIPNDVIQLPNGYYMGNGFRAKAWGSWANQEMCRTHGVAWYWSNQKDAEDWQVCRHAGNLGKLYEWPNRGWEFFFQNTSMIMMPGDPYVYVFGTPEGRYYGPGAGIYLRRAPWDKLTDDRAWQFWAFLDGKWQWQNRIAPSPILKPRGGSIGEIDAKVIEGKVVLAYVDGKFDAVARVADRPDAPWSAPKVLVSRSFIVNMYAPSIHPWSTLRNAYINLSEWNVPKNTVYGVHGFSGSLV